MQGPTDRHDVAIVGGGLYGAAILFHLAKAGTDAVLLERTHLADGPTGRSSANVRLLYTTPELREIAAQSFEITTNFRQLVGGDNGFKRVGVLYGIAPDEAAAFEPLVERLAQEGRPIETRTVEETRTLVPGFDLDGFALTVWEPTSGYADPVGTTVGFADAARLLGASVRVACRAEAIEVDRGHVRGVRLAGGGRVEAARVVVAAGPWSRAMLEGVGRSLPTFPERHAISLLSAPEGSRGVVPCVWSDRIRRYYARPEGDSLVLLGGTTSQTRQVSSADELEPAVSLEESAEHVTRATPCIRALGDLGIRPGYASVYDMSPDGFPIADAVPGIKGLFVMAGTSGHGYKLAPAMARLVADLVRGRRSSLLNPFRIARPFGPTGELAA
jgi:glycine/D-amino acid oxidase-like deaminating enzyme